MELGSHIVADFDTDRACCLSCDATLGSARSDPRRGCLAELTGTAAAGPARGQDYGEQNVMLARFYCPGCGRQLDASVLYRDLSRHQGYLPASALAGPPAGDHPVPTGEI